MMYTVSSESSLQVGRSNPIQGELVCLDEAVFKDTVLNQVQRLEYRDARNSTRRRLGEQLGIARQGGTQKRVRRRVSNLEGALSQSALATPSGERSIRPSGPSSLGRIPAFRAATLQSRPSQRRGASVGYH